MDNSEIWGIIIDKLDFIVGLIIGLAGSIYSWYQRQVEFKIKLYYPLYNLLLIFDEIRSIDEDQGRELYNASLKHLDDIMKSHGTIINLKRKSKEPGKDYLNIFLNVKRVVDLNQNLINTNWPEATIIFENGKKKTYTGADSQILRKIDEFNGLYSNLLKLKELCERG